MPRNRKQTEIRILKAARTLLRRDGFSGWGINPLAREARCDKVLIYRYFASLDGVLDSLLADNRFWPDPATLPDHSPEGFIEATAAFLLDARELHAMLTLPQAANPLSPVQRAHSAQLEEWLDGFRQRCDGRLPDEQWQLLAALLFLQAITGETRIDAYNLWRQLSPPLEWNCSRRTAFDEELPTELL